MKGGGEGWRVGRGDKEDNLMEKTEVPFVLGVVVGVVC